MLSHLIALNSKASNGHIACLFFVPEHSLTSAASSSGIIGDAAHISRHALAYD